VKFPNQRINNNCVCYWHQACCVTVLVYPLLTQCILCISDVVSVTDTMHSLYQCCCVRYWHNAFFVTVLMCPLLTPVIIFRFKTMGYKSAHVGKQWVFWENNGFFWKQICFYKAMFLTQLYTWFILIVKHMFFIKIKTIHVLHKLFFQNTIPHRSHSLIGHVIQELW